MRRNVIPIEPPSAQQLRSEQRGSYRTPRPAGNPLMVFLLPCLPNLLPPSWLKGRELWGCALCCCSRAFSSTVSLHSGTSGCRGAALAPHTEECLGAPWQSPQHWVMADSCRTPQTLHQCCAKASQETLEQWGWGSQQLTIYLGSALACTAHHFFLRW